MFLHIMARNGKGLIERTWVIIALGDDFFDHSPGDVGQAEVSARMSVGECFVFDSEKVENRRM